VHDVRLRIKDDSERKRFIDMAIFQSLDKIIKSGYNAENRFQNIARSSEVLGVGNRQY